MWSVAVHDLNLTEEQFLSLTPAKFDALVRRNVVEQQRRDYRAGVVATLIAYSIPTKKKKKYGPATWFPSLKKVMKD